jgi:hypothetical protein
MLERSLCEEVHLNLDDRWLRRVGLDGAVPEGPTFSMTRHDGFRESDADLTGLTPGVDQVV